MDYYCGDKQFEQWMHRVDAILANYFYGLTSADLSDRCWRDDYDSEATPLEAVTEAYGDPSDIHNIQAAVMG